MSLLQCAVLNCYDRNTRRYHFPRNKEVCQVWVDRVGNVTLQSKTIKQLNKMCVCARHFSNLCMDNDGNLKKYSLPTLHLPSKY